MNNLSAGHEQSFPEICSNEAKRQPPRGDCMEWAIEKIHTFGSTLGQKPEKSYELLAYGLSS